MLCQAKIKKTGKDCLNFAKGASQYCGVHAKLPPLLNPDGTLVTGRTSAVEEKTIHGLPPVHGNCGRVSTGERFPTGSMVVYFDPTNVTNKHKKYSCFNLSLKNLQCVPPIADMGEANSLQTKIANCAENRDNYKVEDKLNADYFVVEEAAIPGVDDNFLLFNKLTFRKYIFQWFEQAISESLEFAVLRSYVENGGHIHFSCGYALDSIDPKVREKIVDLYDNPQVFPQIEFLVFVFLVLVPAEHFWCKARTRHQIQLH